MAEYHITPHPDLLLQRGKEGRSNSIDQGKMTENAISAQRSNETCSSLFSFDGRNYRHGQSRPKSAAAFRPAYCDLDKKVLRFFAYFVEDVGGKNPGRPDPGIQNPGSSGEEDVVRRVRHVHILYFLEDDTISVTEPKIKASTASPASRIVLFANTS